MKTKPSLRPLKWKTIERKYPDEWVAVYQKDYDPSSTEISFDGVVVYHHPNSTIFHTKGAKYLKKYGHLAIAYTGDPFPVKKGERILLSIF